MKTQKQNKKKGTLCIILGTIFVLCIVMFAYLNDGYEALQVAETALTSDEMVTVEQIDGAVVFMPEKVEAGLIFYPGGKVDHEAYAMLMNHLAKEGMACILLEMPFDLAVFAMNAAEDYRYLYPEIKDWYVGGHSLGGAMAASYLEKHIDEYEGLVLYAAYSTVDYSETDLKVISMYGSNDEVLNAPKYEECRKNLPEGFAELVIEGGNHAFFGTYGLQEGDGTATIENSSQIAIAAEFMMESVRE
ncbi:MAG: alpha/beta hydrolase [Lachnospiraceae bacterium]|nr:alpha/beta hydrolase [Lachnospiraceae bacterium]